MTSVLCLEMIAYNGYTEKDELVGSGQFFLGARLESPSSGLGELHLRRATIWLITSLPTAVNRCGV